jgi:hypothetical protein
MKKNNYCKNCKYWKNGNVCDKIEMSEEIEDLHNDLIDKQMATIQWNVHDDSGLYIYLKTKPDFGCNYFEAVTS